jgi:hypothetical protein
VDGAVAQALVERLHRLAHEPRDADERESWKEALALRLGRLVGVAIDGLGDVGGGGRRLMRGSADATALPPVVGGVLVVSCRMTLGAWWAERMPLTPARDARVDVRVVQHNGHTELGGEQPVEGVQGPEDALTHLAVGGGREGAGVAVGAAVEAGLEREFWVSLDDENLAYL